MMALQDHPQWLQDVLTKLPPQISIPLAVQKTELIIALAVVLLTILISALLQILFAPRGRKSGSAVIIAGPCNSGKTTLFLQLRDGTAHNGTVASMQENIGVVAVKNDKGRTVGAVKVVDVPGHERLRHKLEKCLADASAVVFVIDAADITPHKVMIQGIFLHERMAWCVPSCPCSMCAQLHSWPASLDATYSLMVCMRLLSGFFLMNAVSSPQVAHQCNGAGGGSRRIVRGAHTPEHRQAQGAHPHCLQQDGPGHTGVHDAQLLWCLCIFWDCMVRYVAGMQCVRLTLLLKIWLSEMLASVLSQPMETLDSEASCATCWLLQAHSVDFVRRTVERQLDSMRRTRTTLSAEAATRAAVLGKPTSAPAAGASGPGATSGGAAGLSLSSLRTPVSTASISALKGELGEVHAFLAQFAR